MIAYVNRNLDTQRLHESKYLEQNMFEMFVYLHRAYNLKPDVKTRYRLLKHIEEYDVYLRLEIIDQTDLESKMNEYILPMDLVQTYIDWIQSAELAQDVTVKLCLSCEKQFIPNLDIDLCDSCINDAYSHRYDGDETSINPYIQ